VPGEEIQMEVLLPGQATTIKSSSPHQHPPSPTQHGIPSHTSAKVMISVGFIDSPSRGGEGMNPLVRDLYKRIITVGRDYPGGIDVVRRKAKEYFAKYAHLKDEVNIKKAVARGRWYVRNELVGVIKLKKYREMKSRYYRDGE
jgi:hypothetical protein